MPQILPAPLAYADPGAVEDGWRPLGEDEGERASHLLVEASVHVDADFPGLERVIAAGIQPAAGRAECAARMVVAAMVRRALVAPAAGYQAAAPGAVSPAPHSAPGSALWLTKAERRVLARASGARTGRAFSVDLAGGT